MNKFKRLLKVATPQYIKSRSYYRYLSRKIDDSSILIDAPVGVVPTANMCAMLLEYAKNEKYKGYNLYVSVCENDYAGRKTFLSANISSANKGAKVTLVKNTSHSYFKMLATSKYLVSEITFSPYFVKREEQIYLNTWHGTPLKHLGRKTPREFMSMGNVQKNFKDADYLLCPNEFTRRVFVKDYMLENFSSTKLMHAGYPRNSTLFNSTAAKEFREKNQLEDKKIYVYMPTWREKDDANELPERLKKIDGLLKDDEIIIAKLHIMAKGKLDFNAFKHIKPFPEDTDSYVVLAACDLLITDYSSVMFDFSATGKKIVLFTYDEETYTRNRGFYKKPSELPFVKVKNEEELVKEIHLPKSYEDEEFIKEFCPYDSIDSVKAVCESFITGKPSEGVKFEQMPDNGKKNVVIYAGSLATNGLTSALYNLLNNLDTDENNYAIFFRIKDVKGFKDREERLRSLPENISYFCYYDSQCGNFWELIVLALWVLLGLPRYRHGKGTVAKIFATNAKRILGGLRIDRAIHFTGYTREIIGAVAELPCKKTIFVHSDMASEIKVRKNSDAAFLSEVYGKYDNVAVVSEGLSEITRGFNSNANIVTCHNLMDVKTILQKGDEDVYNVSDATTYNLLKEDVKKYVCLGRFSPEKGHLRLMKVFLEFHKTHKDTCLIILGSTGPLLNDVLKFISDNGCAGFIRAVPNVKNPYPIIKRCDVLVSPSYYEGFGLTLPEADMLGVSCFSLDCPGTTAFMKKYGGAVFENSEKGLMEGLVAGYEEKLPKSLSVDYEEYNKAAIKEFTDSLK
ncbi:MAG: CDP-glycerol glycerophosphotransferase family protein [Lachnospiraceae bacterium]|nr:CDP-glycerol glycerophosphotransferase family protein [Lachnospiraceae bacterium]